MALIEGRSLDERLDEGPLAPGDAAAVAAELAEALAYAHALGVVHRDVKPANVRIDHRGDVYLMDFGIAYRPDSNELPLPPGTILGTPAYVAPEQAEGGRTDPLPASDQYSLGAVFYELLCGRPPFVGPPSYVLFHAIHREPPSPRTVEPKVPRALAAVCLKALAKRPDRRYPDCQALADDLRRWLRRRDPPGLPPRLGAIGPMRHARSLIRRSKMASRSDRFFTEEQQRRLGELMAKWRAARDAGLRLSPEDQAELEGLVDDELRGAAGRAAAIADGLAR